MAKPKKKRTKSSKNNRRSHHALKPKMIVKTADGIRLPHQEVVKDQ